MRVQARAGSQGVDVKPTNRNMTLALPVSAADVATLQREAEANVEAFLAFTCVDDAEDYATADALLTGLVRKLDTVVAMRRSATVPLYGVIKLVEGWFKPVTTALETPIKHLKHIMGEYRVNQDALAIAAREVAAQAADAHDAQTLHTALAVATAAAEKPAARSSTTFAWVVDRVIEDLLPDEWWAPARDRLDSLAKSTKGEDPPVVPGVVFKRVARIGAKR